MEEHKRKDLIDSKSDKELADLAATLIYILLGNRALKCLLKTNEKT